MILPFCSPDFPARKLEKLWQSGDFVEHLVSAWLCERAFRSRLTLRKEGQVELRGETPKQLSAARYCETCRNAVNTIFSGKDRRFQFKKSRQFFIRVHNETLSVVAVRVGNKDRSPVGIKGRSPNSNRLCGIQAIDGWPINPHRTQAVCYFLPAAALLVAAHRAFISWESLFRPAGVSPPFFRARFTHRAFAAAESFALVAADILFPPVLNAERDKAVPRREARRFSKVPIWRRIKSASSNDLRDMSMSCG
jgi:hypothetical protein